MIAQGIDVSKHNGLIDFNAVKEAGIEFVIIRAGYGKALTQVDPYFEQNYRNAKRAGLKVGAYWYSYTETVQGAVLEAQTCINAIKGKLFDLPIYPAFSIVSQKCSIISPRNWEPCPICFFSSTS